MIRNFGRAADFLLQAKGICPAQTLKPRIFGYIVRSFLLSCEKFFFVQIGGYDGVANDYLHPLIVEHRLQGIIVEPQSEPAQRLRSLYRHHQGVTIEQCAISAQPGQRKIYRIKPPYDISHNGKKIAHSIASLDPSHAYRYARKHSRQRIRSVAVDDVLECETIECITFAQLIERHAVERCDMLFVDAEGSDFEIVSEALQFFAPSIVNFEHKGVPPKLRKLLWRKLADMGYDIMTHRPDGGDTVAVLTRELEQSAAAQKQ